MTDQTRLAEIRAGVDQASSGPWEVSGDKILADVAREIPVASNVIARIDADFIAHARQDVPFLLDLVDSLTKERDALLSRETRREADYDELAALRLRSNAELAALRAVIEEALEVVTAADETPEMVRLFLVLDRGLKGAGE